MKAILLIGLVLLAALAGCIDDDDPEAPGDETGGGDNGGTGGGGGGNDDEVPREETGLSLSDLAVCDLSVVEGSGSVPCENQFDEAQVESRDRPSTAGDQMICVKRDDNESFEYWVFWDVVESTYGIYYEAQLPEGVSGVHGVIHKENSDVRLSWSGAGASGWIQSTGLTDAGTARMTIYGLEYESDTEALQGGEIRTYWSVQDEQAYPLQVVSAGEDYYFNNVSVSATEDVNLYRPKSFGLGGSDFNITVEYTEFFHQDEFGFDSSPKFCALT